MNNMFFVIQVFTYLLYGVDTKIGLKMEQSEKSSIAFPKIFDHAFQDGYQIRSNNLNLSFNTYNIGNLNIESGKIVACDPIVVDEALSFDQFFPIGDFPVQLSICNKNNKDVIAFSRVLFSNNPVHRWEFALYPGQLQIPITSEEVVGYYGVDSGMGLFVDDMARKKFNYDQDWEKVFVNQYRENRRANSWSYVLYEFDSTNVIAFSSGEGDGQYNSYVGKDNEGNICQLLTDFNLINWWRP